MKKDDKILDELLKKLTGLSDNPTYDDFLKATERIREENQINKKFMAKMDKRFYDFLQTKKDQP